MKAVIYCPDTISGLRPLTECKPAVLLEIVNRPVIDIIICKLIKEGIDSVDIITGIMSDEIYEYCESRKYDISLNYYDRDEIKEINYCSDKEDILFIKGNVIFDFPLNEILKFHKNSSSVFTVCVSENFSAEESLFFISDVDSSIIRTEKIIEENSEDIYFSDTGIYVLKAYLLNSFIKEGQFYRENFLREIFISDFQFLCCLTDGFIFEIYDPESLFRITKNILDKRTLINPSGQIIYSDMITSEGAEIKAPCLFGNNFIIKQGAQIGPYCVFSDNCTVEENSEISRSIFGRNTVAGNHADISSSVVADNVKISDHCSIEKNCIIGYGCRIERFSRLLENCLLWPGRRIAEKSVLYDNVYFETPLKIEFNEFGMSGKVITQFTPHAALKTGEAAGSLPGINRIGIGTDGNAVCNYYKDICKSGICICGTVVYDYCDMLKSLVYFYSAYCSLDIFIYISLNGDIMNFSFFGKNGMPLSFSIENEINRIYRYSCIDFSRINRTSDCFNMKLFDTVYSSYLKKIFKGSGKISYSVESENNDVKKLFTGAFGKGKGEVKNNYQFLVNYNSTQVCVLYKDKFYSHSRLISLISEIKFAEGKDIVIPEDSPSFIEMTAEKYGCSVTRCFECSSDYKIPENYEILENLWAFDALFLCAELLNLLDKGGCSLEELFVYQNDFSLRKNIIEYNCSDSEISSIINLLEMKKQKDGIYYILEDKKGIARLRKIGNSHKIKLLVEASDIEAAKELSSFISSKFDIAYIDKDLQK